MEVQPPGSALDRLRMPHVSELFIDREHESTAFKAALATFRQYVESHDRVGATRHNLLTFYGLGGIGKTALSERLEAWINDELPPINGWGPRPPTEVQATARIDLHGSAGRMDLLAALLSLRSGVARLRPRWPVFDLAFAAYWSAVRPGEPLPRLEGRDDLEDAAVGSARDALADLGSLADLIGAGTGAGLGVAVVRKLIGELRRRHDLRLGINAFSGFETFLMRCGDEPSPTEPRPDLACEIAGVLAWELSTMNSCPLLVVFVDTTERFSLDPRRVSEGHLNKLIHQMPNVLFVLTGRDMLNWHDSTRVDLPHRGTHIWPDLVPGTRDDPRQHLVGNLSPADTKSVILRGRSQLDLPMSDEVVEELVKASAGLPQYLELARQVAISIRDADNGQQVEIADVTGSLGSLVMRVLDDIPADEQRAIRGACLFRIFDTSLMAAAANVDHGCAERAALRPMVDYHEGGDLPYRMHDAVRESIREADHQIPGGWSATDWKLAASRAATATHRLHDAAKKREDNRAVLDAVGITINLVCDQETTLERSDSDSYTDWLSKAIVFSPSIQGLQSRVPGTSRTEYGQHVLNFIAAKSITTPMEDRLRLLRGTFESDHSLRLPAGRHLGYTLKLQQRWDEALTVFDELVELAPTPLHLGQRPQVLSSARRFFEAREAANGIPAAALITRKTEYFHGLPDRYFTEIGPKLAKLRTAGRQREYLEERGTYLVRKALLQDDLDTRDIDEFLEEAELVGHVVAIRSALLATILHHKSDSTDISAILYRLRILDLASSSTNMLSARYALAEFCDAMLSQSHDRLKILHDEVAHVQNRTSAWIPVECFFEVAGLPLPPITTQWLEPHEIVIQRWAKHLQNYLASHRFE